MQHDEAWALAAGARWRGAHLDGLFDPTVVEAPVEPQRAKARVAQLADLACVLDDRDDARTEPAHPGAKWQRRREGRRVGGEVARRFVEPPTEERRYVCLADEDEHVVSEHAAQRADRAAPLILDEPAQDDIRPRGHVTLEPVAGPRAGDVVAVATLRADPLETVFRDDVEERLALLGPVLPLT